MTRLLTHTEYASIASSLQLPTNAWIDGRFRPAVGGKTFATLDPASDTHLADVAACDSRDVDLAVVKAREAFTDGRWSRLPPTMRKGVLLDLARRLERRSREFAVMESLDSGKTILDCETVDLPDAIGCLRWHAEAIDKLYDEVSPASDDHLAMILREPIGVVGLVLPWNFPLLMLAWKLGPALASGCSVIVKPAEETSLTALALAEIAAEAGLPAGVLNVLPGSGPDVGEPLGRHADVDMVSFTGSTETGRRFLGYAAESNINEVVLEMGGKNPCIVMEDAEPLDRVAAHVVAGAFWNMGENCSAISRLIVHRDVVDALLARIVAHLREWPLGDPLDPATRVGPLVSKAHFDKVSAHLAQLPAERLIVGGESVDGRWIQPTVVHAAAPDEALLREEIFGPVLAVITVGGFDEALRIANDTRYGLTASLFTSNVKRAIRGARILQAGTVTINSFGEGDASTPFGGYGLSGFGGRDKSLHAHEQYTRLKTLWIDLADDLGDAVD